MSEPAVRNISDTALWVAIYRARESERKDALFHDPFARRLAGERGEQIASTMRASDKHSWAYVIRTLLIDQFITDLINQGADMVVNLAAGLDARPYRMRLPSSLKWIDVDLPELNAYKESILKNENPVCSFQRISMDLSDVEARRNLFQKLGNEAKKAIVITEGLIVYFSADEVKSLAQDLYAAQGFQYWITDLVSPRLLRMIQKEIGGPLEQARAPLKFGPAEGPDFFTPQGWNPVDIRSSLHNAAKVKRTPFLLSLFALLLPDSKGRAKNRPWGGIILLAKNQTVM
jgi:methyltransferase (TIGR00027 family)